MLRLLAITLVLATQAGDGSCAPTPKACDLSFAGITVEDGKVLDTVTVVCDLRPVEHFLQVWMEYKPFDEFDAYDRTATTRDIPGDGADQGGQPVRLTLSSPCLEGTYRTRAYAKDRGPVTENTPQPIPFEFEDTGWPEFVSAERCAEGDGER